MTKSRETKSLAANLVATKLRYPLPFIRVVSDPPSDQRHCRRDVPRASLGWIDEPTLWQRGANVGRLCNRSFAGVTLGLVLGTVPLLKRALDPVIEALRPLPVPAIVPPLILFLGIDSALKVTVAAISVTFPVLVSTLGGVQSIDPVLLAMSRTFGKSRMKTMTSVVLPAALPSVFAGLRIALAIALVTTVVAEMIAGSDGIGYYLVQAQFSMYPAEMYGAVFLLIGVGYLLNKIFVIVESRLLHWNKV